MNDTLYLDGICSLCTRTGKFLSKRLISPLSILELQSDEGESVRKEHNISQDTLILIRNERPYIKSAAAIRCLLYMRWNWRWLFPFAWMIPLPIRDFVYILVSKFRKKI